MGAVLLATGVVGTVGVAWAWAAWGMPPHSDLGQWTVSREDSPFWLMQGHGGAGALVVRAAPIYATGRNAMPLQNLGRSRPDVPGYVMARFHEPPTKNDEYRRFGFDERGWPLRCLRSEHSYRWVNHPNEMVGDVKVMGGIQIWPEQAARGGWALQRVRALPLIPIWPAFVINALLYAGLVGIFCIGYPAMIRTLGARRSMKHAIIAGLLAPFLVLATAWIPAVKYVSSLLPRIHSADRHPPSGEGGKDLSMERQDRFGGTRLIFSAGGSGTESDRMPPPPINGAVPCMGEPNLESRR